MPKKQKDGRYRGKVTVPGVGAVYVSGRTTRELEEAKKAAREKLMGGHLKDTITFRQLVVNWWTEFKLPRVKTTSTRNNYRTAINRYVLPFFPEKQLLRAVQRKDLQACLDACAGKSAGTIENVAAVLRGAARYGLAEGLLAIDISASLLPPAGKQASHKTAFNVYQSSRILEIASQSPDGLILYLLYYLGLRRGEMLGLQWGDVDFHRRMVRVCRSIALTESRDKSEIHKPKTQRGKRSVPMPQALYDVLLPLRGQPEHYIVSSDGGKSHLTEFGFSRKWTDLMIACGFTAPSAPVSAPGGRGPEAREGTAPARQRPGLYPVGHAPCVPAQLRYRLRAGGHPPGGDHAHCGPCQLSKHREYLYTYSGAADSGFHRRSGQHAGTGQFAQPKPLRLAPLWSRFSGNFSATFFLHHTARNETEWREINSFPQCDSDNLF